MLLYFKKLEIFGRRARCEAPVRSISDLAANIWADSGGCGEHYRSLGLKTFILLLRVDKRPVFGLCRRFLQFICALTLGTDRGE